MDETYAMPDNSTSAGQSFGDWAQGQLSYALNRYIDSEFPQPWQANDPGMLYTTGGTRTAAGTPGAAPAAPALSPALVFGGLALFGVLLYVALK